MRSTQDPEQNKKIDIQVGPQNCALFIKKIGALLSSHLPSPDQQVDQYACWILEAITKTPKNILLTRETITITQEQSDKINSWLQAIINKHTPLQYLIGSVPFG